MWPFKQKHKARSLGEMIAYTLSHDEMRHDWKGSIGPTKPLVNDKLGVELHFCMFDYAPTTVKNADGESIPLEYHERGEIGRAVRERQKRFDREKRDAALVKFVDGFERAYGK